MKMRTAVIVLAMLLGGGTAAVAQKAAPTDSHERAAEQLIELLRLQELTEASYRTMMEAMMQQNPALAQFRDIFEEFFAEYARWEELYPEYVRIYREAYTEAELQELITFYQTPVGRKTVELMPRLMQQGAEVGQRQIQPHLPELERRIQERIRGGTMR